MKRKSKSERRVEKDLIKIGLFFVFLIFLFLVASEVFKSLSQFEYQDLTFTKTKYGDLQLYRYHYYYKTSDNRLINYVLLLKRDPRSNDIPIEGSKIEFPKGKSVYISVDGSELQHCPESAVAIATLSAFLTDNQVSVIGATNDFIESSLYKQKYITCENRPSNVVINMNSGNETRVEIDGFCHRIEVGPDCDIIGAIEKYELQSILDARP